MFVGVGRTISALWRRLRPPPPPQGDAAAFPDALITEDNEALATEDTAEPIELEGVG